MSAMLSAMEKRTYRLPSGVIEVVRVGVDGLALNLVGPATVVTQTTGGGVDISLGHEDRLAIVERLDRS